MIGFILPNLLPSQILDSILELQNVCLFIKDDICPFDRTDIPVFSINYVHNFIGRLYVFDLDSAEIALNILSNITVNFIATDLEWMDGKTDFVRNINIYRSVDNLYSRKDHVFPINSYCNRKPLELEDLKLSWILKT